MPNRSDKPFFVPRSSEGKDEEFYQELARRAGCAAGAPAERVYSITFVHDQETWTATVGEKLRGTKVISKGRGRSQIDREVSVSNEASVLAIFDHVPFMVWHDGASPAWSNPFMAGQPRSITYFAEP